MGDREAWSQSIQDVTRDVLGREDVVAFSFSLSGVNQGCTLDHLDGRYGYITLTDALNCDWRIFDYQSDELLEPYSSIDDFILGGWKVST